jgi:hypothetical protein
VYTNCAIEIFIILPLPPPLIFFRVANKTQFPALAKLMQKSDWSRVSPMQFGMQTLGFFANKLYTCKCSVWIKSFCSGRQMGLPKCGENPSQLARVKLAPLADILCNCSSCLGHQMGLPECGELPAIGTRESTNCVRQGFRMLIYLVYVHIFPLFFLNLSLKGLSHEIDFKTFDKNLQNLA